MRIIKTTQSQKYPLWESGTGYNDNAFKLFEILKSQGVDPNFFRLDQYKDGQTFQAGGWTLTKGTDESGRGCLTFAQK